MYRMIISYHIRGTRFVTISYSSRRPYRHEVHTSRSLRKSEKSHAQVCTRSHPLPPERTGRSSAHESRRRAGVALGEACRCKHSHATGAQPRSPCPQGRAITTGVPCDASDEARSLLRSLHAKYSHFSRLTAAVALHELEGSCSAWLQLCCERYTT